MSERIEDYSAQAQIEQVVTDGRGYTSHSEQWNGSRFGDVEIQFVLSWMEDRISPTPENLNAFYEMRNFLRAKMQDRALYFREFFRKRLIGLTDGMSYPTTPEEVALELLEFRQRISENTKRMKINFLADKKNTFNIREI